MKRLNIFVDETGEFGFDKNSSKLYGISFTFHEQKDNIKLEINNLNERLERIGYSNMIHMADLIMSRGDYSHFDIKKRKNIFKTIFHFARKIPVRYYTIIIDKKYTDNTKILRQKILNEINTLIKEHEEYFNKFDKVVMYYDNGQETLGTILDSSFNTLNNFEHKVEFNHKEKRLFQVSDMLTYIDKYDYKYRNKMSFSKSEKYFFTEDEIRKILRELSKKRL